MSIVNEVECSLKERDVLLGFEKQVFILCYFFLFFFFNTKN